MIDAIKLATYQAMLENKQLPEIALDLEVLWRNNAELREAYAEASRIAKKWIAKAYQMEAVARAAGSLSHKIKGNANTAFGSIVSEHAALEAALAELGVGEPMDTPKAI